jgi:GT2 family glycosyltransferase
MSTQKIDLDELGPGLESRSTTVLDRVRVEGKNLSWDNRRSRVCGVTYGPFAPNHDGLPFPARERVRSDFKRMYAIGINSIRTYHVPPRWLLAQAEEQKIRVLIDVPWSKHLCFIGSRRARVQARKAVRDAALTGRSSEAVLAYSIGNEIPADIVRWHGARHIECFLAELMDTAKQVDPERLITYANYPLTEYLDLSFLDFATFNIYLHDLTAFQNYLSRIQNLVGERPLVLGETGMDTLRHREIEQAEFLAGHVREAMLMGLAGAFVFSWTDDWHAGGYSIDDWAFGITRADRTPKISYHWLGEVFDRPVWAFLPSFPPVSVVVCTYNGGRTLDQCLRSLQALDYPDFEVIVVDDGSTDDTHSIVARHPNVRTIRQENQGLGVARNAGLQAASGDIIAYTDSDCFADPDWLTHLVDRFQRTGAAAAGGPNLTPEDGWLVACVAAAPGQPTHVLMDDQTAEHIPGCNMAFRREALEAINGFDPLFRKAGDDVDVCWRLQHEGYWITFAPGAIVWHHRRQTPLRFLQQQAGYGEAEGLLHFKHPAKFTGWGSSKWRGVAYGNSTVGLRLSAPLIYRGTFGAGMFQCLYRPVPAHWAMLPTTLEWHGIAALLAIVALLAWPPIFAVSAGMIALSITLAVALAAQARLPARHDRSGARLLIAALCYLQPIVRSWARYRARPVAPHWPHPDRIIGERRPWSHPWVGSRTVSYWSERGPDRIELLSNAIARLDQLGWGKMLDTGWSDWDLEVYSQAGIILKIVTVQEDHGAGKLLVRIRYRLSVRPWLAASGLASVLILAAIGFPWAVIFSIPALGLGGRLWWRAGRSASRIVGMFDALAAEMRMVPCTDPN